MTIHPNITYIFDCQSKFGALDGATDMLEDFAAKCVLSKANSLLRNIPTFTDDDILKWLQYFYNQVRKVCLRKLTRGKEIAKQFAASNTWGGRKLPDEYFA